jgi:opacity protein-like surface antigen
MKLGKLLLTTTILAAMTMTASAGTTYVGAQVGASGAKAGKTTSETNNWKTTGVGFGRSNNWNWHGGVLLGHQYQHAGHIVLGGSVGFNMETTTSKQHATLSGIYKESTARRKYVVNFLAKAGHTGFHSKFTPYLTAGAALTKFRFDINTGRGANDANLSKTTFGWTGGAGLDYMVNSTVNVAAQYLYTWYPNTKKQITLSSTTYQLYAPKGYHAATIGVNVKI